MSMLKKTAALTVSAVLLLQPMTASAVTWSNIVDGLRNSGSNRYTEDGTTIEKDGDSYTISGGTITGSGSSIYSHDFGNNANVLLKNLIVEGYVSVSAWDGDQIRLEVDKDTLIKRGISGLADGTGNSVIIVNNGKVRSVSIETENGGYGSVTNNGEVNDRIYGYADGNGSISEIENAENGTTGYISINADGQGSQVNAVNNGNGGYIRMGFVQDSKTTFESGHITNFVNNGDMINLKVGMGDGTFNFENNGTYLNDDVLHVSVQKGTPVEEIISQTEGLPNANYINVVEIEQDEYDSWSYVKSYIIIDGVKLDDDSDDDPENPNEPEDPEQPENPEQPETPEQPEATQQPTFEVSKYDQERHEMEEKRKEEAIGGVYGSPYWVKQLYLGYHSLNLRLFVGEQQSNFKQSLSWMPDSTKQLTLRVNTDAPEKLTMRLDEKALETLERTEFSVITLLDKSGNAVMQYSLTDLRSVYDQYGLSGDDQMVVGGANDDVMKIVNGEMKPIEA